MNSLTAWPPDLSIGQLIHGKISKGANNGELNGLSFLVNHFDYCPRGKSIYFFKNNGFGQRNLKQGKAHLPLKNWKNLIGDQREDSLTSLEVCFLPQ